jgi:hypothetical protein
VLVFLVPGQLLRALSCKDSDATASQEVEIKKPLKAPAEPDLCPIRLLYYIIALADISIPVLAENTIVVSG